MKNSVVWLSLYIKTVVLQPCKSHFIKSQITLKEREHVCICLGETAVRDNGTVDQAEILEWFIYGNPYLNVYLPLTGIYEIAHQRLNACLSLLVS